MTSSSWTLKMSTGLSSTTMKSRKTKKRMRNLTIEFRNFKMRSKRQSTHTVSSALTNDTIIDLDI